MTRHPGGNEEAKMRTETILITDHGPVLVPLDMPIAALAVALSYVGGILRWNRKHCRLEVVNPFRGMGS